jgi:hypothetical protein
MRNANLLAVLAATVAVLLTAEARGAADDVSGTYRVRSMGKATDQTVQIEKLGDGYKVTWMYDGGGSDTGIGILNGDVFSVSWKKMASHFIYSLNVRPNGNLSGRWFSVEGETNKTAEENWIKK